MGREPFVQVLPAERRRSIFVVPDNRADIISPKNLDAVLSRFDLHDQFRDAYNRFFQLAAPGNLPFPVV